jgi:predicted nucleic acid-binding protein
LRHVRKFNRASLRNKLRLRTSVFARILESEFLSLALLAGEALHSTFENLSLRHTARHGFRVYDLIHVASALLLGCDTFWSFDAKASRLAALEGLKTIRQ